MNKYRLPIRDNRTFDGSNICPIKFGIDRKWLKSRILKKKLPNLLYLKLDAQNTLKDRRLRSRKRFLLQFAHLARKLIPSGISILQRYRFGILKTKWANPARYFKFFMGYPTKGQRTWSNAKSAKKRINYAKLWEEELTQLQFKFTCPISIIKNLTHLEYLNLTWSQQWHHEWVCAFKYREDFENKQKYKAWEFGFDYANKNRALTYYADPYKMKRMRGKKKIVLPKNQINVGLETGFAKIYFRKIFSTKIWKKKKKTLL